jgi:hypothetical protein
MNGGDDGRAAARGEGSSAPAAEKGSRGAEWAQRKKKRGKRSGPFQSCGCAVVPGCRSMNRSLWRVANQALSTVLAP